MLPKSLRISKDTSKDVSKDTSKDDCVIVGLVSGR